MHQPTQQLIFNLYSVRNMHCFANSSTVSLGMVVQMHCESWGMLYKSCSVSGAAAITNVTLVRQYSSSACVYGKSYGGSTGYIWVDDGCRATFNVSCK